MTMIREEELNTVIGGETNKIGSIRTNGYLYDPGDHVTDIWNPENGVGEVIQNVGVCGHWTIDQVHFPDVNQTYNQYESNLLPA